MFIFTGNWPVIDKLRNTNKIYPTAHALARYTHIQMNCILKDIFDIQGCWKCLNLSKWQDLIFHGHNTLLYYM
jgi:hypothetical protein